MSYSITVSASGKYFRIRVDGETSVELARKWSAELQELGGVYHIKRFLFDARLAKNMSSVVENYQFAYKDSVELSLDRSARSAILASQDDDSHNFLELAMSNAGFDVRVFTDESLATGWLDEDD
jgi:hypothetical protein